MGSSGAVVIITGAGGGIGRALAIGFCRDGDRVVGFGRTEQDLFATSKLCEGGRMEPIVGDVASEGDVDRLISRTLQRNGKIDVLINNAAVYPRHRFLKMSPREWAEVIEVNLIGAAMCCRKVLPSMLERAYGRIINMGSFAGRSVIPESSAYSVSKAGITCLTKALAVEIDRTSYPDVLVNEMVPGGIKSGMNPSGDDPATVYPHARTLIDLPAGGPTGRIFIRSELFDEDYSLRAGSGA